MKFQILSHAGLAVSGAGITLLCDPWVIGSAYWRAWWNYPPVSRELLDSLHPDFIYLTHIHWDHFHGISLRRFGLDTPILIPYSDSPRIAGDLRKMGFRNVRELKHGESLALREGFVITSYHFNIFLDSALVIECDGVTLLNANDSKLMGLPLRQVLRRHPSVDFVFRSHSSANSRLCYEIIDDPTMEVDDAGRYVRDFAAFARATGARFAIPFASNHCFLHKDVFPLNHTVTTPDMVRRHFEEEGITKPEVKIMVSGDWWSSESGFAIEENDYFDRREQRLEEYREASSEKLEKFYSTEARAKVRLEDMAAYFGKLSRAIPYPARRMFKSNPVTYVLRAGEAAFIFEVDIYRGTVRELDGFDDERNPIQVHTSAFVMRHCMAANLFSHLAISKRVKYRVRSDKKRYMRLLNSIFNYYEYDLLPLRKAFRLRVFRVWARRWREIALYFQILGRLFVTGRFEMERYLPARERAREATSM
jgi:UDP-MurNAc hydroxylase